VPPSFLKALYQHCVSWDEQDPGLPSQWPFKEELVKEFAWKRAQILADEKRKKEEKKARRMVG